MAFEFIVALLNTLLPICLQSFIAGSQEHARKQVEKLKYRTENTCASAKYWMRGCV